MAKNSGVDPRDVVSPQSTWQLLAVLYESERWSMAIGRWKSDEGKWRPVLAQRWNGWAGGKGNPISRGFPTWFIMPDETYGLYLGSEFIPAAKLPFVKDTLGIT